MMITEPIVSKKFDVENIRKIKEFNFLRHIKMTRQYLEKSCKVNNSAVEQ